MDNEMRNLYSYMLDEFPSVFTTHFSRDLLYNILEESQKIDNMTERCEWLAKILPQVQLKEIRNVLLR